MRFHPKMNRGDCLTLRSLVSTVIYLSCIEITINFFGPSRDLGRVLILQGKLAQQEEAGEQSWKRVAGVVLVPTNAKAPVPILFAELIERLAPASTSVPPE